VLFFHRSTIRRSPNPEPAVPGAAGGIAAPHEEMPRFPLADEQIDTIVACINSLSMRR
jgi:hypothetical protein